MKALISGCLCLAILGCSHTHNLNDMVHGRPPEKIDTENPRQGHFLLGQLLNANKSYWIAAAIRRGKSVIEAVQESDIIYSALTPATNDSILSSYGSDAWEQWEAYKQAWEEYAKELELKEEAYFDNYRVESKPRIAKLKAEFDKMFEEMRARSRKESEERANETDD